jgi:serine/threonine protein kinase
MLEKLLNGRYQIVRELGAGGFGKTYLAQDTQLPGRPACVVKQLQPQSTEPYVLKIANRLFQQEAEVLQKLGKHPQIPSLLAHFESHQEFFLVQEFIDGHDLTAEVTIGQKWSEAEAKALLEEILVPLAAVHQKKVIHRDIKPANLMRRQSDGRIFLIDFGAVKQVAATQLNHRKKSSTVVIGTEGYMPTEQSSGRPHLGGSDIYALGIVILQALTGTQNAMNLMAKDTIHVKWRHLATVSPAFGEILDKMVASMVENRYHSAMEVIEALRLPVAAAPVGQTVVDPMSFSTTILQDPSVPDSQVWLRLWIGLLAWTAIVSALIWSWSKNLPNNTLEPVASTPTELSTPSELPPPTVPQLPNGIPTVSATPTSSSLTANLPTYLPSSSLPSLGRTITGAIFRNSSADLDFSAADASSRTIPNVASTRTARANSPSRRYTQPSPEARRVSSAATTEPEIVDTADEFDALPTVKPVPSTYANRTTRNSEPTTSDSDVGISGAGVNLFEAPMLPVAANESQETSVRKYFQQRWKADPNFGEALQYKLLVSKTGSVTSIEGQTETSRMYLDKTSFLRSGMQIASANNVQDQSITLILRPDGEVQTLVDTE